MTSPAAVTGQEWRLHAAEAVEHCDADQLRLLLTLPAYVRHATPTKLNELLPAAVVQGEAATVALLLQHGATADERSLPAALKVFADYAGNLDRQEGTLQIVRLLVRHAPALRDALLASGYDRKVLRTLSAADAASVRAALQGHWLEALSSARVRQMGALLVALLVVLLAVLVASSSSSATDAMNVPSRSQQTPSARKPPPARAAPSPLKAAPTASRAPPPPPSPPPPPAPVARREEAPPPSHPAPVASRRPGSAEQVKWLKRFGMDDAVAELARKRAALASALAEEKAATASSASAEQASRAKRDEADKLLASQKAAAARSDFDAAAKLRERAQKASADAGALAADAAVAATSAREAASSAATRGEQLRRYEALLEAQELAHATVAVHTQHAAILRLRADLARATVAEAYAQAKRHTEQLADAERYMAELRAYYALPDPAEAYEPVAQRLGLPTPAEAAAAAASGAGNADVAAAEAHATLMTQMVAVNEAQNGGASAPSGSAKPKSKAVRDLSKWVAAFGMEAEVAALEAQRRAAGDAAATAARLRATADAYARKASEARKAAVDAEALMIRAADNNDPKKAEKHQKDARVAATTAAGAEAKAVSGATERDAAEAVAAASAATLERTEAAVALQERESAKRHSYLLQQDIAATREAYAAAKEAKDFGDAQPLLAKLEALQAERAALLAAYGLAERDTDLELLRLPKAE